jgi:hypothetical protein
MLYWQAGDSTVDGGTDPSLCDTTPALDAYWQTSRGSLWSERVTLVLYFGVLPHSRSLCGILALASD